MTQLRTQTARRAGDRAERPRPWPLAAAAAGLLGLLSSSVTPGGPVADLQVTAALVLLLLAAAGWRRWVEPRVRSTAAALVPLGLVVSAAALVTRSDWPAWSGVSASAGAVAWMALRERTVSSWIGVLAVLPAVVTFLAAAGADAAGAARLAPPAWLFVAGLGLRFGRSTITR